MEVLVQPGHVVCTCNLGAREIEAVDGDCKASLVCTLRSRLDSWAKRQNKQSKIRSNSCRLERWLNS